MPGKREKHPPTPPEGIESGAGRFHVSRMDTFSVAVVFRLLVVFRQA